MTTSKSFDLQPLPSLNNLLGDSGSTKDEGKFLQAGLLCVLTSLRVGKDSYMGQNILDIIEIFNTVGYLDIFLRWYVVCSGNRLKINCFPGKKLLTVHILALGCFASNFDR